MRLPINTWVGRCQVENEKNTDRLHIEDWSGGLCLTRDTEIHRARPQRLCDMGSLGLRPRGAGRR